jgi:glutamate 5-kinase
MLNLTKTLNGLLAKGIIPVINEKRCPLFREIRFGDNDNLSATYRTDTMRNALPLSDIDGLYEKDPNKFPHAA